MGHTHPVYDTDTHFIIDSDSREVSNAQEVKKAIFKGDHNSERLTFQLPRYIDGHDMTLCNVVQVHWNNVDASTREQISDAYTVTDLKPYEDDESIVVLSWLIDGNATTQVGMLAFSIRFSCVDENNKVTYAWNTAIHSDLTVKDSNYNGEIVAEDYADILAEWEARITALEQGGGGGADWNASEGEAGYVQNRTHYDEVVDNGYVLPETDLNSLAFNDDGSALVLDTEIVVFAGEQYKVYWDGRKHTTTCVEIEESDVTGYVLGNFGALTGGVDTGEPFVIMTAQGFGTNIIPLVLPTSNQIISIEGKTTVAHELPRRFLASYLKDAALSPIEYECTTNIVYTDSTTETSGQRVNTGLDTSRYNLVRRGCIAKLVIMDRDVTLHLRFTASTHNERADTYLSAIEVFSFIHPSGTWMDVVLKMKVDTTGTVRFWLYPFNVTLNEPNDGLALITFTIDGTEYQAEEGMTWGEWVDSEYDNEEWFRGANVIDDQGDFIVRISDNLYAYDPDVNVVHADWVIKADHAYTLD